MAAAKKGLYANIKAKKDRIAHGSGEHMRSPGEPGAPARDAFAKSAKTAPKKAPTKKAASKKVVAKKATAKKVAKKAARKVAKKSP